MLKFQRNHALTRSRNKALSVRKFSHLSQNRRSCSDLLNSDDALRSKRHAVQKPCSRNSKFLSQVRSQTRSTARLPRHAVQKPCSRNSHFPCKFALKRVCQRWLTARSSGHGRGLRQPWQPCIRKALPDAGCSPDKPWAAPQMCGSL